MKYIWMFKHILPVQPALFDIHSQPMLMPSLSLLLLFAISTLPHLRLPHGPPLSIYLYAIQTSMINLCCWAPQSLDRTQMAFHCYVMLLLWTGSHIHEFIKYSSKSNKLEASFTAISLFQHCCNLFTVSLTFSWWFSGCQDIVNVHSLVTDMPYSTLFSYTT